ncbi:hypothetical protein DAI22_04g225400 [Oryza sativa Japonica Group]|nr:hypothetical protein DAI22_05g125800 [Oryza sativa Japonica Group]KAF2935343.1 hypothetical protein DAI22_04g225400 [Oryza sativa Japonica Group]
MHRSENEILIQGLGSFYRGDWEPRSAVGGYEHFESKVMRSSAAVSCSRAGLSSRERRRAPARASAAAAARASAAHARGAAAAARRAASPQSDPRRLTAAPARAPARAPASAAAAARASAAHARAATAATRRHSRDPPPPCPCAPAHPGQARAAATLANPRKE